MLHRASAIRASGSSVSVYALLSLPQCVSVCVCVSDRLCESAAAKDGKKNAEKGRCHARPLPKGATRGVWWRSKGVRQCNDLAKELGQGVKYIVQASPFCTP